MVSSLASCILLSLSPAFGEKMKHRRRCGGRRAFEVPCCVFRINHSFGVGKSLIYQYKSDKISIFLKEHQQISMKRSFEKYCSWDKAQTILSFLGHTLTELFGKLIIDEKYKNKVQLFIHQTICL